MACAATMASASHCVGLVSVRSIFLGMVEFGSLSVGTMSSASPMRQPAPSWRTLLSSLVSDAAITFSTPDSSTWRAQAANSCPSVTGTALILWVRPILTMSPPGGGAGGQRLLQGRRRRDQGWHRLGRRDVHHGREAVDG